MRAVAWVVLVCALGVASRAFAADGAGAPGPLPPPAQAAPPTPAPYPPPPLPPAPYPYAYPYPYAPPPGYGAPGYGFNPNAAFVYESQHKSPGLALVIEFLVPGLGSIYADHVVGAGITWGLVVGGFAVIVWEISDANSHSAGDNPQINGSVVFLAVMAILAGRIYGLVDSYMSAGDYNRALAQRLGLPGGVALGVTPLRTAGVGGGASNVAWAPSLEWRF